MYLIVTRSFPPEIGGMQNLMWGLTNELSKHYMLKFLLIIIIIIKILMKKYLFPLKELVELNS